MLNAYVLVVYENGIETFEAIFACWRSNHTGLTHYNYMITTKTPFDIFKYLIWTVRLLIWMNWWESSIIRRWWFVMSIGTLIRMIRSMGNSLQSFRFDDSKLKLVENWNHIEIGLDLDTLDRYIAIRFEAKLSDLNKNE